MDNMHVQPPSHQLQVGAQPAGSVAPSTDPFAPNQPTQTAQSAGLGATVNDSIPMTPENIAAAVSNTQEDPTKPRFENGELVAGQPQ